MRSFLLLYSETGGGGSSVPDMLFNLVGDDSTQVTHTGAFGTPWVDRIGGESFGTGGSAYTMYSSNFGGHKAMKLRDDVGSPEIYSSADVSISDVNQGYTWFFAMNCSETTVPNKTMFNIDAPIAGRDTIAYYWISNEATVTGQLYAEDTWTGSYNGTGVLGDVAVGSDKIFTIDCQGTAIKWYVNNVLFSTNAGYWADRKINESFSVLSTYANTTRLNNSMTAEIRIYPTLTDDERATVVTEMMALYSIT